MNSSSIRRNPWPRVLIAYFVVFASAMVAWVAYAVHQKTDLVSTDYYAQEILYQQQVDRISHTQAIRGQYSVSYDAAAKTITIGLPQTHARGGATGKIHLYRPSDAKLDRDFSLAVDGGGHQTIPATELRPGLWKVRTSWEIDGQGYFFDEPVVMGAPQL